MAKKHKKKRKKAMPTWAQPGPIDDDPSAKGGHRMTGSSRWCIDYKTETSGKKKRICGFHTRWEAQRYIGLNWDREGKQIEKPKVVAHRMKWKWKR